MEKPSHDYVFNVLILTKLQFCSTNQSFVVLNCFEDYIGSNEM